MSENNSELQKEISVTLDKSIAGIESYELFLIRGTSDYMEVQLAKRTETDKEIRIHVESIFRIPKHALANFAKQFTKYLQEITGKEDAQE